MKLQSAVLLISVALGAAPAAQAQVHAGSPPQGRPHARSEQRQAHEQSQLPPLMRPVPPLPAIGLPLPPIGLPAPGSYYDRPATKYNHYDGPRRGAGRWRAPGLSPYVLLVPYGIEVPYAAPGPQHTPPPPAEQGPPTGRLWMDIEPAGDWQLFVDGYYVGTTGEFGGGIELEAGPHSMEIRASGYEPLRFGVNISASRSMTYRDTLTPSNGVSLLPPSGRSPEPTAPTAPITLYVIPSCYAGNVPPEASTLPKGCDPSLLSTVER
jgi:hypothetical protein